MMDLSVLIPKDVPSTHGNCVDVDNETKNLFSREDVFSAADAAAICATCPIKDWCELLGYESNDAVPLTYGGKLFKRGRPVSPRQVRERPTYKE